MSKEKKLNEEVREKINEALEEEEINEDDLDAIVGGAGGRQDKNKTTYLRQSKCTKCGKVIGYNTPAELVSHVQNCKG